MGVSLKNNQPKIKDEGIPRYSNGARVLGDITLYAKLKRIEATPPSIPINIISNQWILPWTDEKSLVRSRIIIEDKYEKFNE